MKRLTLVLLLLLGVAASARPPVQRPVNNPRPGQATTTGVPARAQVATGQVSTLGREMLVLVAGNGQKLSFKIDATTTVDPKVSTGSQVLVTYEGTLESGVYHALLVKAAPGKAK